MPRREAAFDPVSERTFVLMNGELATYQTGTDHWDVVAGGDWLAGERQRPWPVDADWTLVGLRPGEPAHPRLRRDLADDQGRHEDRGRVGLRRAHQHMDGAGGTSAAKESDAQRVVRVG